MNQFELVHKLAMEKRHAMQKPPPEVMRDPSGSEAELPAGSVRCGCGRLSVHPGMCSYRVLLNGQDR